MAYRIFLDDLRTVEMVYQELPSDYFLVVRTYADFCSTIIERGLPDFISFDNDLGLDDTGEVAPDGYAAAKWLVFQSGLDLSNLEFRVHSANIVAAVQIRTLLENYKQHLRQEKGT